MDRARALLYEVASIGDRDNCARLIATALDEAEQRGAERAKQLLAIARCPNDRCVDGAVPVQVAEDDWNCEQCQWCDERDRILAP